MIVECPTSNVVLGIDVSKWQAPIDWAAVRASGREFAYVKAFQGHSQDPRFVEHSTGSKSAGLRTKAYVYFQAADVPTRDLVSLWAEACQGCDAIALDVETPDSIPSEKPWWTDEARTLDRVLTTLDLIREIFGHIELYTGAPAWFPRHRGNPWGINLRASRAADEVIWWAAYTRAVPTVGWSVWQYGVGDCPGVRGPVDLDCERHTDSLPLPPDTLPSSPYPETVLPLPLDAADALRTIYPDGPEPDGMTKP